jgi:hypothetical protein
MLPRQKGEVTFYNKKYAMKILINETQLKNIIKEESLIKGSVVWRHIKDITPDKEMIPNFFKKDIVDRKFKNVDDFDIESLLNTDPDFKEYYDGGEDRYGDDDDVSPGDLSNEIVVVDGILLDGYSRVSTLLRNGEKTTYAYVATKKYNMNLQENVNRVKQLIKENYDMPKTRLTVSDKGFDGWGRVLILKNEDNEKIGSIIYRRKNYLESEGFPWVNELHLGFDQKYQRKGYFQDAVIELLKFTNNTPTYLATGRVINPNVFKAIDKLDRDILDVYEFEHLGYIITLK